MTRVLTSLLALIAVVTCHPASRAADATDGPKITHLPLESIQPASLNAKLKADLPTVDVAVYLGESRGQPHGYVSAPEDLRASFVRAREIFSQAGVQLKLRFVRRAIVPTDWLSLDANEVRGALAPAGTNRYESYRVAKWGLTKKATRVFEGVIEKDQHNHRTLYLLYLRKVRMAYPDPQVTDRLQVKHLSTTGLSLPAYLFETRMPRRTRGAIAICKNRGRHGRLIAHELGHKLINVSHEYREIGPQFEVRGEGGLMIYGRGTEIPAGKAGRWNRERLHLSPFIYRIEDGVRRWNADYREGGHYYDPLYGNNVVRFGKMVPR